MADSYHHGDLHQAFIDAALRGLDEDGELPSWRALARACAVSHTAPYRHFANFQALRAAVSAAAFERMTQAIRLAASSGTEPYDRLARGLRAYIDFGRAHPSWYELMFGRRQTARDGESPSPAGVAAYDGLISAITACGVAGASNVAFTLWGTIHGVTDLASSGRQAPVARTSDADPFDDVIAMCLAHVRTAARAKPAK